VGAPRKVPACGRSILKRGQAGQYRPIRPVSMDIPVPVSVENGQNPNSFIRDRSLITRELAPHTSYKQGKRPQSVITNPETEDWAIGPVKWGRTPGVRKKWSRKSEEVKGA
jgi:hypothetical protein